MMDRKLEVSGLEASEQESLSALFDVWDRKRSRNRLRTKYYDGKNVLQDLGIALPPQMRVIDTVVGWPAKAVQSLAVRSKFESIAGAGSTFGLNELLDANDFGIDLSQAIVSAYKHSCSFLTVAKGEPGEPEFVIIPRSAEWSSALWDNRRRQISAALFIVQCDDDGIPSEFVMHLPGKVVTVVDGVVEREETGFAGVLVVPLVHDPQLDRPFGTSRISRPVMSVTNAAMRTVARTETHAEFFAYPQRFALGVPDEAFDLGRWESAMATFFMITRDEDGNLPEVGQFAQSSMQPHIDMLRELAARFAGETDIPISTLGIVHDNPASAEAIYAASEPLVTRAEYQNKIFSRAILRLLRMVVALRDGMDVPSDELLSLDVVWANPAQPSAVSAADAILKQVSAVPWLSESSVILEKLGYSAADILRLQSDKQRAQGGSVLDRLLGNDVG